MVGRFLLSRIYSTVLGVGAIAVMWLGAVYLVIISLVIGVFIAKNINLSSVPKTLPCRGGMKGTLSSFLTLFVTFS